MRGLLDLHDDVLYVLGQEIEHLGDRRQTLFNAGSTCRKLRKHFAPFLYRRITQSDTRDDSGACSQAVQSGGRPEPTAFATRVQGLLRVLETSTMVAAHTQEVNIEKHEISQDEALRLVAALTRLQELRKLRFALPDATGLDVSGMLRRCRFTGVVALSIFPCLKDLSTIFPNVEALNLDYGCSARGVRDWSRPLGYQHLQHLELGCMPVNVLHTVIDWKPSTLKRLAENLPGLEYLGTMRLDDGNNYGTKARGLEHFRNLRDFSMCWTSSFWDDVVLACQLQDCNKCVHMKGKHDATSCRQHIEQIMHHLGQSAFWASKSLERMWIGRHEGDGGREVQHGWGMVACDRAQGGGIKGLRWNAEAKLASPFFPLISDRP